MKTLSQKINSLFLAFCLLSLALLTSCNKDNGANPDPKPNPDPDPITIDTRPACRITKFYNSNDPTEYTTYQYDNQDKLLQYTGFYKGKEKAMGIYEYNQDGRLVKLTLKDKTLDRDQQFTVDYLDVYTFEYNSKAQVSKYTRVLTSGNDSPITFEVSCEYDNEGNRTKMSQVTSGNAPYIMMFTYKDGNCIKADYGVGLTHGRTEEYEYFLDKEDKLKPFNQSYTTIYITGKTAPKNVIKKTVITSRQTADLNSTLDYSHEFNDKGFATKHVVVYKNNTYSTTTTNSVEYECN